MAWSDAARAAAAETRRHKKRGIQAANLKKWRKHYQVHGSGGASIARRNKAVRDLAGTEPKAPKLTPQQISRSFKGTRAQAVKLQWAAGAPRK